MKLCFNTSAYGWHDLDYALRQIAGFDYWGVEMQADRPHAFPADFDAARRAHTRQLPEELNLHPVGILSSHCDAWGCSKMFEPFFINKDAAVRAKRIELTKEIIDLAADVGCPHIQTAAGIIANAGYPLPRLELSGDLHGGTGGLRQKQGRSRLCGGRAQHTGREYHRHGAPDEGCQFSVAGSDL